MAVEIPDFSTYSNEDLLAIASEQTQAYLDAYNGLQAIAENPAQDGVDNFFSTLGTTIEHVELQLESESAQSLEGIVNIEKESLQDKFDYAEAFCFEWFHRFYPLTGFFQFKFTEVLQSIDYDNSTDTITVTNI